MVASSFWIVPRAVAVPSIPPVAPDSVTVKLSSGSTNMSPLTLIVTSWLVCAAVKLTVPLGSTLPVKSAALAGLPPLPVTA